METGDGRALILPRQRFDLIGHAAAERQVLKALDTGRMPHAWLITGPRGIGKATFAYRFARFMLADGAAASDMFGGPPPSLQIDADHPVAARVAASGHGDLLTVERSSDPKSSSPALRTRIVVEQIRGVGGFFAHTSAEGGWRIAIVDGAEEMNPNAANALLKILEEPPQQCLLLLVSHAPGRLLATIRSRCRVLQLRPLSDEKVGEVLAGQGLELEAAECLALARLSEGSPGRALALAEAGGLAAFEELLQLFADLPDVDYTKVHGLADRFQRREGAEAFRVWIDLFRLWLSRMVRGAAAGRGLEEAVPGESGLQARLLAKTPLDRWVELWEKTNALAAKAEQVNLDRKQVILTTFFELERTARGA